MKGGDERIQMDQLQWCNRNTAGDLSAESLIAKDPSIDLPEPTKFVRRRN